MVKILIGVILLAHGFGHTMGLMQAFRVATINPQWNGSSWLLRTVAGETVTQVVGSLLWTVALVGFVAVAAVVFGWLPETWWAPLAIGSSLVSLVGVILFPLAFPTFSTVGAVAVNLAVLLAVGWLHWTPSDLAA
jgi:hypothetical protein